MKFPCFWPEKYENKKLCVSCVALHKKHVCNLCTHKNNMCVTCVLYLKIEVEKSTCVYVRYVWCAVLDSTLLVTLVKPSRHCQLLEGTLHRK